MPIMERAFFFCFYLRLFGMNKYIGTAKDNPLMLECIEQYANTYGDATDEENIYFHVHEVSVLIILFASGSTYNATLSGEIQFISIPRAGAWMPSNGANGSAITGGS